MTIDEASKDIKAIMERAHERGRLVGMSDALVEVSKVFPQTQVWCIRQHDLVVRELKRLNAMEVTE